MSILSKYHTCNVKIKIKKIINVVNFILVKLSKLEIIIYQSYEFLLLISCFGLKTIINMASGPACGRHRHGPPHGTARDCPFCIPNCVLFVWNEYKLLFFNLELIYILQDLVLIVYFIFRAYSYIRAFAKKAREGVFFMSFFG